MIEIQRFLNVNFSLKSHFNLNETISSFAFCHIIKRENQEIVFNKFYNPFDDKDKQKICTRSKSNFKHMSSEVPFFPKCFDNIFC
uniref:Uncharacterized protein n=1 Tax=Glossina palpalis gambiensis TaxID=67801 RepID=A0A1B0APH2_9MUSC